MLGRARLPNYRWITAGLLTGHTNSIWLRPPLAEPNPVRRKFALPWALVQSLTIRLTKDPRLGSLLVY